jgi:hypothetical protein
MERRMVDSRTGRDGFIRGENGGSSHVQRSRGDVADRDIWRSARLTQDALWPWRLVLMRVLAILSNGAPHI